MGSAKLNFKCKFSHLSFKLCPLGSSPLKGVFESSLVHIPYANEDKDWDDDSD